MVTRRERSSFSPAFLFLGRDRRAALDAVYAFCRHVDDAVDDAPSPEAARAALAGWRARLDRVFGDEAPGPARDDEHAELVSALRRAARRYPLRRADFEDVIEGCEWDLSRARYATWEDLRAYCLHVASAVGLLCIAIFGAEGPRARAYAVELGLALQLTNILRDVDEDGARGRVYLPAEDLAAFGAAEADLVAGRRTPAVLRLLRFEAQRARLHYLRARATLSTGDRPHLLPAEIMGDVYYALLEELVARDFPAGRVRLSTARKSVLALGRVGRFAAGRITGSASASTPAPSRRTAPSPDPDPAGSPAATPAPR